MIRFNEKIPYTNIPELVYAKHPGMLVCKRVVYHKPGHNSRREGWRGLILNADENRFTVLWDDSGVEQSYQIQALANVDTRGVDMGGGFYEGYIYVTSLNCADLGYRSWHEGADVHAAPPPPPTLSSRRYFVVGERGGKPEEIYGENMAREHAKKKARESKSGQAYVVYKAECKFQRQEPPVIEEQVE